MCTFIIITEFNANHGSQWIDPKTGIGAVLIVNIRPHGDAVVASLYRELEEAVYGGLLKAKGKL